MADKIVKEKALNKTLELLHNHLDSNYAQKDGFYPDMTVGVSQNLLGKTDIVNDSAYRTVGGDSDVLSGFEAASIESIQGNAIAWNQLINPNNSSREYGGATLSYLGNGKYNIKGTTTTSGGRNTLVLTKTTIPLVSGHKTLVWRTKCSHSGDMFFTNANSYQSIGKLNGGSNIYTVNENLGSVHIGINVVADVEYDDTFTCLLIDLTLIYGAGNEPTTAEQFEADYQRWFGRPLTYEEYDEGSIRPVLATGIKTVGFNLAYIDNFEGDVSEVKRKPIFENHCGYQGMLHLQVDWTAENENVRPRLMVYYKDGSYSTFCLMSTGTSGSFQANTNVNVDYIVITSNTSAGHITAKNLCINFSWSGKRDGEYESHWEEITPLPITTLTGKLNGEGESVVIFPDGLKRAGQYFDEIKVVNGVTKAIKRVQDMHIENMELVYTLCDEPEEYIIDNFELPTTYKIDDFGTEQIVSPENGITPILITKYGINAVDAIRRLPQRFENYYTKPEIDGMLQSNSGSGETYVEITYSELKALKDASKLVPGTFYRITDYVGTCKEVPSNNTYVATPFDVIIQAISPDNLSEEGFAAKNKTNVPSFIEKSDLSRWRVWYCLENDTTRFKWADEVNGKGVIYRLMDDRNNDIPWDFYSIRLDSSYISGGIIIKPCDDKQLNNILIDWYSSDIKIGYNSKNIRILTSYDITIGDNCDNVYVSDESRRVTIGNNCKTITVNGGNDGAYTQDVTIGNNCDTINVGNPWEGSTVKNIVIGNNCSNIIHTGNDNVLVDDYVSNITVSRGTIHVLYGDYNNQTTPSNTIDGSTTSEGRLTASLNANGEIILWTERNGVQLLMQRQIDALKAEIEQLKQQLS